MMKLICDKLNCMYLYTKHEYSNVKTTVKKKSYTVKYNYN